MELCEQADHGVEVGEGVAEAHGRAQESELDGGFVNEDGGVVVDEGMVGVGDGRRVGPIPRVVVVVVGHRVVSCGGCVG